jgi:WD40 repeat protein
MLAQTIHTTSTAINDIPGIEPSPNYPYGAIWSIRFSKDGKYLASAGQNCVILLWKLIYQQQSVDGEPDSSSTIKVLDETPFREYKGHQADILDLAWSKVNTYLRTISCVVELIMIK